MPLLNDADAVYVGAAPVARIYLGSVLVWQAAAPGGDPPLFVGATTNAAFTGSDQPVTVDAPAGVAADDWQLTAVYSVSDSPTFPAAPAGWSKILDEAVAFPDGGTSTGRLGLFESTSALTQFSVTMSQNRVWNAVRVAYRGALRPAGGPLFVLTPLSTTHATPAADVTQGGSTVVMVGASELANGGADWGWTGFGAASVRGNRPARNAIESAGLAVADVEVSGATNDVSATFTLAGSQRAAMAAIVLHGAPA